MASIDKMIKWMQDHHHSVCSARYSMTYRYGNPNYDCSSAVFYALIAGGFLPKNQFIGNTETLFALARAGKFKEIYNYKDVKRGDIFIRGGEGTSAGAGGHTGIFLAKDWIIHCNYPNNGISTNNMSEWLNTFLDRKRSSNERYFRPIEKGSKKTTTSEPKQNGAKKIKDEKWHGITQATCNVRSYPSTSAPIVAQYGPQQTINYDSVYEGDGYRWISYIGYSGKRRYVAYRPLINKNDSWMKF